MAAARGEVDRARTKLRTATEKVRTTWKANPQWIVANDALTAARKDYDAARAGVIEKLKRDDPVYRDALNTQADAQARLRQEQDKVNASAPAATQPAARTGTGSGTNNPAINPNAKPDTTPVPPLPGPSAGQVAAATDKLEGKAKIRNMEDVAVTNDANASKAQAKLREAETAAKIWQAQLDAALKNDPDYAAALDQMTAARAAMTAAAGQDAGPYYDNYGEVIYFRN